MDLLSFSRSKIQVPHCGAPLVPRHRLAKRLAKAQQGCRLLLLTAPAGYGKSAALAQWVEQWAEEHAVAWISLERNDGLSRLIACLVAALDPYDPPWRMSASAICDSATRPAGEAFAAVEIVRTLEETAPRRGVIVLDDLHVTSDPRIGVFLDRLVGYLPSHWTLAIASRTQVPFSLDRLRASHELVEVPEHELELDLDEVRALCIAENCNDPARRAAELLARTGGWAAGVRIALRTGAQSASASQVKLERRHIHDYLRDEVFVQLPAELRDFLVCSSVLREMSAATCEQITRRPDAEMLLMQLEERGLLVTRSQPDEAVFRLHDLLRDFLLEQLRQQGPERYTGLLRRCAAIEADVSRVIALLIEAGAFEEAGQRVLDTVVERLPSDGFAAGWQLVGQFPAAVREGSPWIAFAQGLGAWHDYRDRELCDAMLQARIGFEQREQGALAREARLMRALGLLAAGDLQGGLAEATAEAQQAGEDTPNEVLEILRHLVHFWKSALYGPPGGAVERLEAMVDLLSKRASPALWYRCMPRIYNVLGRRGIAGVLQRFVDGALHAAGAVHSHLRLYGEVLAGWLLLWNGQLDETAQALQVIQEDDEWLGQPVTIRVPLLHLQAAMHAVRGDPEAALAALYPPASRDERLQGYHVVFRMSVIEMAIATMTDCTDRQQKLLADIEASPSIRERTFYACIVDIWRMIDAMHQGLQAEEAAARLRVVVQACANADRMGIETGARLLLCSAELAAGHREDAWNALKPVMERFRGQGLTLDLLSVGQATLENIAKVAWGGLAPPEDAAEIQRWLRFVRGLRKPSRRRARVARATVGGLSAREMEVLQHLARGESNKVVAHDLHLSPNTVKRHVARIMGRIGVSSRVQAAVWYHQHGAAPASSIRG